MTVRGNVRFWSEDEGWGVVDSSETPGGCWVHFSSVQMSGFRILEAGQAVELEWEAADQDGFNYRSKHVRPFN